MKKRRRVDISASQKQYSCLFKEQNPKSTQADILVHFSKEWGVTLKDKAKWLAVTKDCSGVLVLLKRYAETLSDS